MPRRLCRWWSQQRRRWHVPLRCQTGVVTRRRWIDAPPASTSRSMDSARGLSTLLAPPITVTAASAPPLSAKQCNVRSGSPTIAATTTPYYLRRRASPAGVHGHQHENLPALRHGLPLVTTTVGAEGMRPEVTMRMTKKRKRKKKKGASEKEREEKETERRPDAAARRFLGGQGRRRHEKLAVAVADEPEEFAQALAEEYHRPANSADEAGAAGRAHLQAHFSRSAQDGALNNLLAAIL